MKTPPKLVLTEAQKEIARQWGGVGGQRRAKKLTSARRKAIATKASKAAARARTKKAAERKEKKSS